MVDYNAKSTASDLSPTWPNTTLHDAEMSIGTAATANRNVSLGASSLGSVGWITPAGVPNNDAWEDGGTQTTNIQIDKNSTQIRARCRVVKLSATGTIIEGGSYTAFQTLNSKATFTFSPAAPTWSGTEACGNRIAIEWEFENLDTMMTQDIDYTVDAGVSDVATDITEDSGGCAGAAAAVFPQIINSSAMIAFSAIGFYAQSFLSKIGLMAKPCSCKKKSFQEIMAIVK